ncbi:MAG: EamA family transporter [Lachnospiraceae bacterium]|nr:EamA family transporter [Lachnospiraceae bacterium]MDD3795356.1 EamA family transporter [Lachnospiraceae bacterium]
MSDISKYIAIWMVSVFISSVAQIMLKIAANKTYKNKINEYLNPLVIISYGIFFLSTLLTMLALKHVPLTMSPIIESTSYIFVPVLGVFILKEKISKRRLLGMGIMLLGIIVFTL